MSDASLARKILSASEAPPPRLAVAFNALAPIARPLIYVGGLVVDYVAPFYMRIFRFGLSIYNTLPTDLFAALTGLSLSFCGGPYCASVAAIEAFRMAGWEQTKAALLDVYADAKAVYEADAADSKRDMDGDGVADVHQLTPQQLLMRKLAVWASAVKDPEKLSVAIGGLYAAWLGVQAVLRIEFAKTITLGISIAEMVTPMAQRVCVPFLVHVLPDSYHHWIPLIIKASVRSLAVAVAWRVQVVVSAFHLALRGGLLCARSLLRYANARGYMKPTEEETYADEVLGYAIAAAGFAFQYQNSFGVPFPLNLVFLPLSVVEWYIRWSVTTPVA